MLRSNIRCSCGGSKSFYSKLDEQAMIERKPVSSSNVKSVGHDPDSNTLEVEFSDGSVYHYHDVPKDVHEGLISSKSVGGFIHKNIKGSYKHSRQ